MCGLDLCRPEQGEMAGCFEYGNESPSFLKFGNNVDHTSDCQLVTIILPHEVSHRILI
jgi:hypothetical protein